MILPTYKSIEEKREFFARQKKNPNKEFEYLQIDTIEDLEEELERQNTSSILLLNGNGLLMSGGNN